MASCPPILPVLVLTGVAEGAGGACTALSVREVLVCALTASPTRAAEAVTSLATSELRVQGVREHLGQSLHSIK